MSTGTARSGSRLSGAIVPAYFHPALDPGPWRRLVTAALGTGFVVINIEDGPGRRPESDYVSVVADLTAAGVPLLGYVDLGYGLRPGREVRDDAERHRAWYGIEGLFLDQAPSGRDRLRRVRRLAGRLRADGASRLALNHGTVPVPGYEQVADVLVTFEGPWSAYLGHAEPPRDLPLDPGRIAHLVHHVPTGLPVDRVLDRARVLGAGLVGVARGTRVHPWNHPGEWDWFPFDGGSPVG